MTKYFWPAEGQTFTQLINEHIANSQAKQKAPSKKRGRPLGSKNKEGHKAGRKDIYLYSPRVRAILDPYDPANLSIDLRRSQISAG